MSSTERNVVRAKAVAAAGLMTETTTRFQTMVFYMQLLNDPIVNARCEALGFEVDGDTGLETCALAYGDEDVVNIITAMTPAEKEALRERIAARR